MDARAVAEAARIGVGTLNVWVQRGSIPGMTVGARGRQRDFDLDTAIHIAIMSELVRTGISAPAASHIATQHRHSKKLVLLSDTSPTVDKVLAARGEAPEAVAELERALRRVPPFIPFESEDDLPKFFDRLGVSPVVYTVINVEQIAARVLHFHEQWVRAGRPANALQAFTPEALQKFAPAFAPAFAPSEPSPAPSKPPARRQRRKKKQ